MLYPIITDMRTIIDLNGVWNFKLDLGTGLQDNWQATKLNDTMPMAVPSSFNDVGVTAEIRNHVGWVWYEREFTVPAILNSERIVLRFGSATHLAKVYVNGELAAEHKGGFFYRLKQRLTPFYKRGKKSPNGCSKQCVR
ncbi:hypothetical protein GCM10020331_008520 [Ectobacillus funiculus]